jgi:hypothetical protein
VVQLAGEGVLNGGYPIEGGHDGKQGITPVMDGLYEKHEVRMSIS